MWTLIGCAGVAGRSRKDVELWRGTMANTKARKQRGKASGMYRCWVSKYNVPVAWAIVPMPVTKGFNAERISHRIRHG